jgi:hypothetical protein
MRHFLAIAGTTALICATAVPAAAQGDGKVQIVRGSSVEIWTPGSQSASPAVLRGTPPAPTRDDAAHVSHVNVFINSAGFADRGLYDVGLAGERFRDRHRSKRGFSQDVSFFPPSVFGPSPKPTRVKAQRIPKPTKVKARRARLK